MGSEIALLPEVGQSFLSSLHLLFPQTSSNFVRLLVVSSLFRSLFPSLALLMRVSSHVGQEGFG